MAWWQGGRGGHGPPSETFEGGAKTIHGNLKSFAIAGPLSSKFTGMVQMKETAPFRIENSAWRPHFSEKSAPHRDPKALLISHRNRKFLRAFGALISRCAFSGVSALSLKAASLQPGAGSSPGAYLPIFVECYVDFGKSN